jgi:hypothetical protein
VVLGDHDGYIPLPLLFEGEIFNGHSAHEFFKQDKIARGIFAGVGYLASILGSLGSIFQVSNVDGSTALLGIGIGSIAVPDSLNHSVAFSMKKLTLLITSHQSSIAWLAKIS